jgi:hypothetical protein
MFRLDAKLSDEPIRLFGEYQAKRSNKTQTHIINSSSKKSVWNYSVFFLAEFVVERSIKTTECSSAW